MPVDLRILELGHSYLRGYLNSGTAICGTQMNHACRPNNTNWVHEVGTNDADGYKNES